MNITLAAQARHTHTHIWARRAPSLKIAMVTAGGIKSKIAYQCVNYVMLPALGTQSFLAEFQV